MLAPSQRWAAWRQPSTKHALHRSVKRPAAPALACCEGLASTSSMPSAASSSRKSSVGSRQTVGAGGTRFIANTQSGRKGMARWGCVGGEWMQSPAAPTAPNSELRLRRQPPCNHLSPPARDPRTQEVHG